MAKKKKEGWFIKYEDLAKKGLLPDEAVKGLTGGIIFVPCPVPKPPPEPPDPEPFCVCQCVYLPEGTSDTNKKKALPPKK